MTIMGKKRDPSAPRKPTRRSGLNRKPAKARTGVRAGTDKGDEEKRFMRQFRGRPCVICGRTSFLKDENGTPILSAGHHLLEKSTHPEYRLTKQNMVTLCGYCHDLAHGCRHLFEVKLMVRYPAAYRWMKEHQHHRKELK